MPRVRVRELDEEGKPQEAMLVDVSEKDVKKLKIGEKVEVTIAGTVGMLSVPPDGVDEFSSAELGIKVKSKKIEGSNEFADLAEDKDGD